MLFYNLLLHLYPASFRNEYGSEMRAIFERRRRDAGAVGRTGLWIETLADTFFNAARIQWDLLRQDATKVTLQEDSSALSLCKTIT